MKVPLFDPTPDIEAHWEEYNAAIQNVLRHGRFILGPEVERFEQEAAEYLGVKHAVGVNSGTDALVIGLRAAGIGRGDEVITTPFSFFATAESISIVGATPVFVDIDPETFNIDPAGIAAAVTDKTRAILPVHLFGRPAPMDAILETAADRGLKVIEDCAQSFGATRDGKQTGSMGDVGAFSFFPTKNLGGFGDGGLIATDDDAVAALCRKLRAHGSTRKYHNEMLGYNSRLDTIQAAILSVRLGRLDAMNNERRAIARAYRDALDTDGPVRNPQITDGHVFHQYTVRVTGGRRDRLRDELKKRGIGTAVYYPVPQDRLPVYEGTGGRLEHSDRAAGQVLSLPIFPGMTGGQQQAVIDALEQALETTGD